MKVRFKRSLSSTVVALIFLFVTIPTFAQESVRVSGVLLDPNNAVVVGGRVTVANENRKYIAYSDDSGRFQFEIPTGSYKVDVESRGFTQYVIDEIKVGPGSNTDLSIPLAIEGDGVVCRLTIELPFMPLEKINAPAPEKIQTRKNP